MSGFTPGPWAIYQHPFTPNTSMFDVFGWRDGDEVDVAENATEANARLIAAAPDLLERLVAIIDWADFALAHPNEFNSGGVRNLDGPVFDEARAAISKATGEAE